MKYAKTFDTIEEYYAEEDTFEFPHLSYILSGDTVIIDLEEEEPEPTTDITVLIDTVNADDVQTITCQNRTFNLEVYSGDTLLSTEEYMVTIESLTLGGEPCIDCAYTNYLSDHVVIDFNTEGTGEITFTIEELNTEWSHTYTKPITVS